VRFAEEKEDSCSLYIKTPPEGQLLEDFKSRSLTKAGPSELLGVKPNHAFI